MGRVIQKMRVNKNSTKILEAFGALRMDTINDNNIKINTGIRIVRNLSSGLKFFQKYVNLFNINLNQV